MAEILDRANQPIGWRTRLAGTHAIEHLRQSVMPTLHQCKQFCRGLQRTGGEALVKKFQFMGKVADRADLDHPRAALEGVQIAQQGFHFLTIAWFGLPAQQRGAGAFDDVEAFFEENLQQLRIVPGAVVIGWRGRCSAHGLALAQITNGFNQVLRRVRRLVVLQLLNQQRQTRMALLQQAAKGFAVAIASVRQAFVKAFQLLSQIADGLDLGHPRAALEGVKIALQRGQRRSVIRVAEPAPQRLTGAVENIDGLFDKDLDDLVVCVRSV